MFITKTFSIFYILLLCVLKIISLQEFAFYFALFFLNKKTVIFY